MNPILPADVEFVLRRRCVRLRARSPTTRWARPTLRLHQGANSAGTVVLDAHGPTSTLTIGGERQRRLWVERDSLAAHVDILKMNLEEAGCSWFPSPTRWNDHDAGAPTRCRASCPSFAEHCLRPRGAGGVRDPRRAGLRGLPARRLRRARRARSCRASRWSTSSTRPGAATPSPPGMALRLPAGRRHRPRLPVRQRDGRPAMQRARSSTSTCRARRPTRRLAARVRCRGRIGARP